MVINGKRIRAAAGLSGIVLMAGCATMTDRHGYMPDAELLAEVRVGQDTRETVDRLLGRPSTEGIVDQTGWYYVRSDYERVLWRAPVETDRQVLAISFDEADRVANIERFGLEAGRVVVLERRVTDSNTAGVSFLRQLFSNLGNFNPGQFFGGSE
ncbi:MAG: outer membrane protein assembly factor BamE [Silicimonas sp.]|nr:outer membrane protein assembly factor BamE [Silicimonas sp.]